MKQLRVLTGRHAGTDLLLSSSTYRISADSDADIQITDWTGEPLALEITSSDEDMSTASITVGNTGIAEAFMDFLPRKFAEIVLCIGPADAATWPSDFELMRGLLTPAPEPVVVSAVMAEEVPEERVVAAPVRRPLRRWLLWGGASAVLVLGGVFVAIVSKASREAEQRVAAKPSVLALAQRAIERSGATGVAARSDGDGVSVEGLLATPNDAARLRNALSELPAGTVKHRYAAASDLAESISEALAAPGIRVSYLSRGDFLVEGQAVNAGGLQTAADRLVNDLAPLVHSIHVAVEDLPPPQKMPTGAMLQTAGMEYVQTRDGTKHISLLTAPVLELKDSGDERLDPQ